MSSGFSFFFKFFVPFYFLFFYRFTAVIDLLLGLLLVQKILRKHQNQGMQILPWSSHVQLQAILLVFFIQISCAYFRLHWANHSDHFNHWKDLYRPPAELEYSWCQFWSKVMMSEEKQRPMLVMAGYGQHDGLRTCKMQIGFIYEITQDMQ